VIQAGALERLLHELPYIAFIVLSLIGISRANKSGMPSKTYWVSFMPVAAAMCMAQGLRPRRLYPAGRDAGAPVGAVSVAMFLMMLGHVRGILPDQ